MEQELTPWFPASLKPARPGVYEVEAVRAGEVLECSSGFAYWTGRAWGISRPDVEMAALYPGNSVAAYQKKPWRGLANPPKEA